MGARRVDQAGEHTDHKGVIAAVGGQVIANVGGCSFHPTGPQQVFRICIVQAWQFQGRRDPGDRQPRRIQQHPGDEAGADQYFRWSGSGEGAEQVGVFIADGLARVSVKDLVGGEVQLFIAQFSGIQAVIGHEHTLQTIQDQQPRFLAQRNQELLAQLGGALVGKRLQRLPCHVGERLLAEATHHGTLLVEGIPEAPGPIATHVGGVLRGPLPGQHALACAADGLKEQHTGWIRGLGPSIEELELVLAPDEGGATDVVGGGVKGGGCGEFAIARIGTARLHLGRGLLLVQVVAKVVQRGGKLGFELLQALKHGIDTVHLGDGVLLGPFAESVEFGLLPWIALHICLCDNVLF